MNQEEIKLRHDRSKKAFPELELEDDEYVEVAVLKAPQSYLLIWIAILFGILMLAIAFVVFSLNMPSNTAGDNFLALVVITISACLIIYGCLITNVFKRNKMFITNKRVTQFLMTTPIASSVNVIDLSSIEDVSYHQTTIIQKLCHFGTLRLATVGDETTYTFPMTVISSKEIAKIVKLVNDDRDGANKKTD